MLRLNDYVYPRLRIPAEGCRRWLSPLIDAGWRIKQCGNSLICNRHHFHGKIYSHFFFFSSWLIKLHLARPSSSGILTPLESIPCFRFASSFDFDFVLGFVILSRWRSLHLGATNSSQVEEFCMYHVFSSTRFSSFLRAGCLVRVYTIKVGFRRHVALTVCSVG